MSFTTSAGLPYDQLSIYQLGQELAQVTSQDKAQNGPVFPRGSLHDRGMFCITCEHCRRRAWLLHALGRRSSPDILPGEMSSKIERSFETVRPPEGRVNNLYDIEVEVRTTKDENADEEAPKV
jgi:hypothetical protein